MKAVTPYRSPEAEGEILHPEVLDPRLTGVEALARWMDYAFVLPGGFRFGLAGIIGLIPGIGDLLDAIVSLYIVSRAIQMGVPRVTIFRMVINVGIEAAIGSFPVLGALFDTVFKANRRNYQLLSTHLAGKRRATGGDWLFLGSTVLLLLAGIALPVLVIVQLAKHL